MFGKIKTLLLMLVVLSFIPSAFAASRIAIPASYKGPTQALINAHKSTRLLRRLQHKNGKVIRRSEYRHLRDANYYLPVAAKAAAPKLRPIRKGKVAAKKVSPLVALQNQVAALTTAINSLKDNPIPKAQWDIAVKDIKKAQDELAAEKLANQGKVSFWWPVAIAIIAVGTIFLAYRQGKNSKSFSGFPSSP